MFGTRAGWRSAHELAEYGIHTGELLSKRIGAGSGGRSRQRPRNRRRRQLRGGRTRRGFVPPMRHAERTASYSWLVDAEMNHAGPGVGGWKLGHRLKQGMQRLFWGKAHALNVPNVEQTAVNATKPKSQQPRRRTTINRREKRAYTRTPL